jgi:hypothetical protein
MLIGLNAFMMSPPHQTPSVATQQEEQLPPERTNLAKLVEDCQKCHEDVHEEWSASQHRSSWTDPVFQAAIKDLPDGGDSCATCHAPRALFHRGFGQLPPARKKDRELGVNCITCHLEGNIYHGPYESTGHGGIDANPEVRSAKMCSSCHGRPMERADHDQGTSYLAGPEGKGGKSCQECHMDAVDRKLVTKDSIKEKYLIGVQPCRKHNFKGARQGSIVAGSADLSLQATADSVTVKATLKTGHSLPASTHREVHLIVVQINADGTILDTTKKVYTFGAGPVLVPGEPNSVIVPLKVGTKKVTASLTQILCIVPGRPAAQEQSIATSSKDL